MSTYLTLSDDNLLAEYVSLDKFKGVLEQRFAVGPDLLAMLIKDGQIAEASHGGHFAVGGVWRTIKDAIGGKHAIRLLLADLKPFQLSTTATALTKDNVEVTYEFTIELQVNPEKPANVLGFMKEHSAVTKGSVLNRLAPHLGERVLAATVRRMDALELRGNNGMQDKIQADALKEVERVSSDVGFIARVVSVGFGMNPEERALIVKRQREREQEALERDFEILNRSVEREADSTIFKLETDVKVEKTKVTTEADLRKLILDQELAFIDAREKGVRLQEMEALMHELQKNRTQRLDGLKAQLEAEDHLIDMARSRARKTDVDKEEDLKGDRHTLARGDITREGDIKGDKHSIERAKLTGERRDVEMDLGKRERMHEVEITRINAEMRTVTRSVEDLDVRQRLALKKIEDEQDIDTTARRQKSQREAIEDLNRIDITAEEARLRQRILGDDAAHKRTMEDKHLAAQTELEKIRLLREGTPEQILAISAGFSPAVANVLVEQAKARATDGADRLALMREMVTQAQTSAVRTEEQARQMFQSGMTGAVGVAHGAGGKTPPPAADRPAAQANEKTECPGCHHMIPVTDRHCRNCGRVMRQ
jgi:hypothetical protein